MAVGKQAGRTRNGKELLTHSMGQTTRKHAYSLLGFVLSFLSARPAHATMRRSSLRFCVSIAYIITNEPFYGRVINIDQKLRCLRSLLSRPNVNRLFLSPTALTPLSLCHAHSSISAILQQQVTNSCVTRSWTHLSNDIMINSGEARFANGSAALSSNLLSVLPARSRAIQSHSILFNPAAAQREAQKCHLFEMRSHFYARHPLHHGRALYAIRKPYWHLLH